MSDDTYITHFGNHTWYIDGDNDVTMTVEGNTMHLVEKDLRRMLKKMGVLLDADDITSTVIGGGTKR